MFRDRNGQRRPRSMARSGGGRTLWGGRLAGGCAPAGVGQPTAPAAGRPGGLNGGHWRSTSSRGRHHGNGQNPRCSLGCVAMTAADVLEIVDLLERVGVEPWVNSGWGVDALLGEQTRPHEDLDLPPPYA